MRSAIYCKMEPLRFSAESGGYLRLKSIYSILQICLARRQRSPADKINTPRALICSGRKPAGVINMLKASCSSAALL